MELVALPVFVKPDTVRVPVVLDLVGRVAILLSVVASYETVVEAVGVLVAPLPLRVIVYVLAAQVEVRLRLEDGVTEAPEA